MAGKKRIALVGGAGFIGHHLAMGLAEQGHEPHVIDGMNVNHLLSFMSTANEVKNRDLYLKMLGDRCELLARHKIPVHVQDARDYHQMCKLLGSIKPEVVVLLAAVSHADRSNKDPFSTFDHSFRTLENALDWARDNIEQFIYFSSSMVYGNFPDGCVSEETPCDPIGIYGALKFSGEKIVVAYNQVFGMPYTIVRPSALYGERCVSRRVGQIFIENALAGREITISGNGEDRLDFTYVGDVVQGISRCIGNPAAYGQVFNLTYGESRSIAQMADIVRANFPDVKIKYVPKDKLMPDRGKLSVDKARKLIDYNPQFPLEKGFQRYIDWYRSMWKGPVLF